MSRSNIGVIFDDETMSTLRMLVKKINASVGRSNDNNSSNIGGIPHTKVIVEPSLIDILELHQSIVTIQSNLIQIGDYDTLGYVTKKADDLLKLYVVEIINETDISANNAPSITEHSRGDC